MATAEEVSTIMAYEFLRMGRYGASAGPIDLGNLHAQAAAADDDELHSFTKRVDEFSGIQVQSVGFEDGPEEPKVHLYLTRGSVREMNALPDEVEGVPVVTHKMGAISVRPETASASTNRGNIYVRNNRICCGTSCGPTSERSSGTLGALVRLGQADQIYLLSNNHVLSGCNHVPLNQPVLAPSNTDGRPDAPAPQEVGRHYSIEPLRSGDPQFVQPCNVDVALARASDANKISSWQGDDTEGYDTPAGWVDPLSLARVRKFGRTTGLTFGQIEARVNTPMPVSYQSKHFKGVVWFCDVWTVRAHGCQHFALPGDSGSLVVLDDASAAVGLVFAANNTGEYAWMISMPAAAAALGNLSLVSAHNV